MKIDTHGRNMTGLKEASGETKGLTGRYGPGHVELFYDCSTGKVWGNYQVGSTYTKYDDPNVVPIGNVYSSATMQKIADRVDARMCVVEATEAWEKKASAAGEAMIEKSQEQMGR